jgi:hypothetical protein
MMHSTARQQKRSRGGTALHGRTPDSAPHRSRDDRTRTTGSVPSDVVGSPGFAGVRPFRLGRIIKVTPARQPAGPRRKGFVSPPPLARLAFRTHGTDFDASRSAREPGDPAVLFENEFLFLADVPSTAAQAIAMLVAAPRSRKMMMARIARFKTGPPGRYAQYIAPSRAAASPPAARPRRSGDLRPAR